MSTTLSLRISGSGTIQTVQLPAGLSRLGRDPNNDILIADSAISRQQATLQTETAADALGVHVTMNPSSPNTMVKGAQTVRDCWVVPGESFQIGPYRFEVIAEAKVPDARGAVLPTDPAGAIDLHLVLEADRVAPRWQKSKAGDDVAAGAAVQRARRSLLLLVGVAVLAGGAAWFFLEETQPANGENGMANMAQTPDPLEAVPKLECQDKDACLRRAQDSFALAKKLRETGGRDLVTVYKIAKHMHRAYQTLGDDVDRIPELPSRYEQARTELSTMFSDLFFRYRQAKRNDNPAEQLAILKALRPLCDEDSHRFCTSLEMSIRLLQE